MERLRRPAFSDGHSDRALAKPRKAATGRFMPQRDIQYLELSDRTIAYRRREGRSPTVLFLPGYASDMEGAKALALDAFAERKGLAMLRLDYSGTGSSPGAFEQGTLALWLEEALAALDQLTEGPVIVAGSSMGGWIALHLALQRPEGGQRSGHQRHDSSAKVGSHDRDGLWPQPDQDLSCSNGFGAADR